MYSRRKNRTGLDLERNIGRGRAYTLFSFSGISEVGAYCFVEASDSGASREKQEGKCVMGVECSKETALYWG